MSMESTARLEVVHHQGNDPAVFTPFIPAIKVHAGKLVFISGITAAPTYHDHPHRPEVFDAVPGDIDGQARLLFENLDVALTAAACSRQDIVSVTRFFTNVREDQDVVNRIQAEWFGGHIPTSTTVEVKSLATDPRLRLEIQSVAVAAEDAAAHVGSVDARAEE
jgi:enamine deaminase RidA (YjgF/YER057c/UK114 family)